MLIKTNHGGLPSILFAVTLSYFFQDVCLLNAVHRYLGGFGDWPAEILHVLFVDYPPPRMMRRLLAFPYGNGAPCPLASQLFHACNTHSSAVDTETFYSTYEEWENNHFGRHMSQLYNLRHKKYVYLNGKRRDQKELVPDMTDPVPLGIYNTDFPFLILGRLERIRAANMFYY
jgi:hypothetical protein